MITFGMIFSAYHQINILIELGLHTILYYTSILYFKLKELNER
jgi:hypothetical protein